jgi:hypothetical protein
MLQRTHNTAGNGQDGARSNVVAMDSKSRWQTASMDPKSHGRARVTNGSELFAKHVDGRSVWCRRFKDLIQLHLMDLGGIEGCSEAQVSLVRRVSTLEIELERLEYEFARPDRTAGNRALDRYSMLANTLRRLHAALGLDRINK